MHIQLLAGLRLRTICIFGYKGQLKTMKLITSCNGTSGQSRQGKTGLYFLKLYLLLFITYHYFISVQTAMVFPNWSEQLQSHFLNYSSMKQFWRSVDDGVTEGGAVTVNTLHAFLAELLPHLSFHCLGCHVTSYRCYHPKSVLNLSMEEAFKFPGCAVRTPGFV